MLRRCGPVRRHNRRPFERVRHMRRTQPVLTLAMTDGEPRDATRSQRNTAVHFARKRAPAVARSSPGFTHHLLLTTHCSSVRLIPIRPDADIHDQRHGKIGSSGHAFSDAVAVVGEAVFADLEHQFVVDLHQHADFVRMC